MTSLRRWIAVAALIGAGTGVLAAMAGAGERPPVPEPTGDIGRGERLLLVVAGEFATVEDARTANARLDFGELTGFFVVPTVDFEDMVPGRWLLVSAFRTRRGANEFVGLAARFGASGLTEVVARYTGTTYIGLGQEPHPDGSGPLIGPLPPDHPERIG